MLANIQDASKISKALAGDKDPTKQPGKYTNRVLSIATLLYLATLGGADLCDMKDTLGSFASGKSFDALLVSTQSPNSSPALWVPEDCTAGENGLRKLFERFLFCGDDRNIAKVWVQGKLVGGTRKGASAEED
jgi:guanine deaminase